jgi:hypothetical protein
MTTTQTTRTRTRKPVPLYSAKSNGTVEKKSDRNDHVAAFIRKFGANEFNFLRMQVSVNRLAS